MRGSQERDGPPEDPTAVVVNFFLLVAFAVFLLSAPALRGLFSALADPFSAR